MNIAEERIDRLHALAREATSDCDHDRTREYVRLARRVAERNHCDLPRASRRFFCDDCDVYLRPGVNTRVRTRAGGHVAVRCDRGAMKRYPYRPPDGDSGRIGPSSRVYDNQTVVKASLLKPSGTQWRPHTNTQELRREAHDPNVTVWVGKSGIESVVGELNDQLADRNLVKVKFLRAALGGMTVDEAAVDLAGRVNADLIETRGKTAVYHR